MSLEWNKIEVKDIDNESDALIEMCDSFYFDKEGKRHTPYINGLPEFIEWDQVPILAQFFKKCNELYQRFQDANLMDLEYRCGHCDVICKKSEIININKEYAECIRCPNCKEYDNFELVFEDLVNSSAIVEAKEETLHKIKKRLFEAFPNAGWDQAPNNDILSYCINLGSYISQTPEFLEVKTKEGLLKIVQDQIRTHKKKILTKNNTFEEELRELRQAILDCNVSTIDEKWETITTMYEQASKSTLDTELDKESIPLKNNYIGGLEPIIDALDDFQLECLQEYIKNKNPSFEGEITLDKIFQMWEIPRLTNDFCLDSNYSNFKNEVLDLLNSNLIRKGKVLIEKIATRIREEAKKNYLKTNENPGPTNKLFVSGMEEGLLKAFSMLKSIIEFKHPQYQKLIEEIEKKTEY